MKIVLREKVELHEVYNTIAFEAPTIKLTSNAEVHSNDGSVHGRQHRHLLSLKAAGPVRRPRCVKSNGSSRGTGASISPGNGGATLRSQNRTLHKTTTRWVLIRALIRAC